MPTARSGFTFIEMLFFNALLMIALAVLQPAVERARGNATQLKDATQLRATMQGSLVFATSNRDRYPLATRVDRFNDVEGNPPGVMGGDVDPDKNRTGALLSIMIFNDLITPEITVSPVDTGRVRVYDGFQYRRPEGANTPARATYDPAFNGTPFDSASDAVVGNNVKDRENVSHNSYAHNCVAFGRTADWRNTASASKPVWSNRGPVYTDADRAAVGPGWTPFAQNALGDGSNTLRFFGEHTDWRGNVAFADSHVEFVMSPSPDIATFNTTDARGNRLTVIDNIFVDERYEGEGLAHHERRNAILRTWKRGIPTDLDPAAFDPKKHLAPSNDADGFAWTD